MNEKEVIRALKSERCPPSVLERVRETIRSEKSSITGWRWRVPVGISIAAVVLLLLVFIYINGSSHVPEETVADKTVPEEPAVDDYMAEAERLKYVFTYIGLTLAEETERNRDIILRNTVPVVKDSIANTEKFINNKIGGREL
ncbi:MAG: hypothetical protein JXR49_11330 [Acidobacteria bacterium]|nr:hypothetical protein [Acidobacteriota bacterium]